MVPRKNPNDFADCLALVCISVQYYFSHDSQCFGLLPNFGLQLGLCWFHASNTTPRFNQGWKPTRHLFSGGQELARLLNRFFFSSPFSFLTAVSPPYIPPSLTSDSIHNKRGHFIYDVTRPHKKPFKHQRSKYVKVKKKKKKKNMNSCFHWNDEHLLCTDLEFSSHYTAAVLFTDAQARCSVLLSTVCMSQIYPAHTVITLSHC